MARGPRRYSAFLHEHAPARWQRRRAAGILWMDDVKQNEGEGISSGLTRTVIFTWRWQCRNIFQRVGVKSEKQKDVPTITSGYII